MFTSNRGMKEKQVGVCIRLGIIAKIESFHLRIFILIGLLHGETSASELYILSFAVSICFKVFTIQNVYTVKWNIFASPNFRILPQKHDIIIRGF